MLAFLYGCNSIEHQWGSFTDEEKQYSYDGKYYSIQSVEYDDKENCHMVFVSIYKSTDDELICELEPCRSMDYWGMVWESKTYNIWFQSADIGLLCYCMSDDVWTYDPNVVRPDDIISKYEDIIPEFSNHQPRHTYQLDENGIWVAVDTVPSETNSTNSSIDSF